MDGILGNLLGGLGGGGQRYLDPNKGYKKTLKTSDFFTADKTGVADEYILLGYYTVGAQQLATVGQGKGTDDPMRQGRILIDIKSNDTTPIEINGFIKITHESAQGTMTRKILEERTEELRQSTRSERLCLPCATEVGFPPVKEDSKIGIYLKIDSADDVGFDTGETDIRLPITIWE